MRVFKKDFFVEYIDPSMGRVIQKIYGDAEFTLEDTKKFVKDGNGEFVRIHSFVPKGWVMNHEDIWKYRGTKVISVPRTKPVSGVSLRFGYLTQKSNKGIGLV